MKNNYKDKKEHINIVYPQFNLRTNKVEGVNFGSIMKLYEKMFVPNYTFQR